ncbi:hypothetical protein Vadar_018454 [Vaccinium darrowii]|uniref:Uncharacterized protein n=1 Tax=Vaccinium darrowii TaxID=229202 RepID=A0ACB7XZW7_9ERIC|nr:hypothetical protein Vadar_018454 [Vaccinium darrowii]
MDRTLYRAASEGNVNVLRQHIDQLEIRTTANRNTALHVAAQFGQSQCVAEILQVCPSLLCRGNIRGETPLHMAAREGYADIVKTLIEHAKTVEQELESGLGGAVKKMLRATNVDGDTALHMAVIPQVRNCHLEEDKYLEVVKLLTREDPEFQHPVNHADETPLYLAAERGNLGVAILFTLLETCTSPTYGGPGGRTALHAATLNDFTGRSARRLLEWKQDLIKEVDTYGWTPLHSAAYNGNEKGVKQLLETDESVVYTTTKKDDLETALHIATARGHVSVMEELLFCNPDCWEMVNSKRQNILHIAVDMEAESAIKFILNKSWLRHLINQKDNEGNTPLHLLVSSDSEVYELGAHHRADWHAFNNKNMTPANIGWSTVEDARIPTFAEVLLSVVDPFSDLGTLAVRNMVSNVHDHIAKFKRARKHVKERSKIIKEDGIQREKEERKTRDEHFATGFQTYVIVAALIATITFTAAFAIPGGYDGNQGRGQGMAVLARAAAFKAFVVTNTIAAVCSVTSIFLCFSATFYINKPDHIGHRFRAAVILILVAIFAMMLAYIAAAFAVLAHSTALAISTCIIACITFMVYFLEIKKCCSRIILPEARQAEAV